MHVTVHFLAQLRRAAGCSVERVHLPSELTLADLFACLGDLHGEPFRHLLLGETGRPHPSLLVFIRDQPAEPTTVLREGDEVTILTPMAGG
jgi:molybdopterin converting factor small subunit